MGAGVLIVGLGLSMSVNVRVRNFQSIEDATVEIEGFTVVTGQNNSGKSSLMRAIRGAFQNAKGTSFIRYGTSKTQVDIEFPKDGKSLHWEKGKGKGDKPTYVLNGEDPLYPGQALPDGVKELGVKPIQAGGREVWPQFAPQFTGQVFLLDQPGSVLAEAVADVERVSKLNEALRFAESDRRAATTELKVRLEDQKTQDWELSRFTGLDELETSVKAIEVSLTQGVRLERALLGLQDLQGRMQKANQLVQFLALVEQVSVPLDEEIEFAEQVKQALETLQGLQRKLNQVRFVVKTLSDIEKVDVPDGNIVMTIRQLLEGVQPLRDLRERLSRAKGQVTRLEGISVIEVFSDTEKLEKAMVALKMLRELRTRTETAVTRVRNLEEELRLEELAVSEATADLSSLLGGLDACPMCGKATKSEVCDAASAPKDTHPD